MNDEISKQVKAIAVGIVGAAIMAFVSVKVQRAAARPDFGKFFLMKRVWIFKRFADGQVRFWENVAGMAANKYNALKP